MHLTLITTTPPLLPGQLSRVERQGLSSVLWGWLSLATGRTRHAATKPDRYGAVLDMALISIDRGTWLQDVAILPPMVLSAVRTAAMLAHLPDSTRQLSRWLLINRACLYTDPGVDTCREVLRLNTTLEGVSGFDEEDTESLQSISTALIRFHWDHFRI